MPPPQPFTRSNLVQEYRFIGTCSATWIFPPFKIELYIASTACFIISNQKREWGKKTPPTASGLLKWHLWESGDIPPCVFSLSKNLRSWDKAAPTSERKKGGNLLDFQQHPGTPKVSLSPELFSGINQWKLPPSHRPFSLLYWFLMFSAVLCGCLWISPMRTCLAEAPSAKGTWPCGKAIAEQETTEWSRKCMCWEDAIKGSRWHWDGVRSRADRIPASVTNGHWQGHEFLLNYCNSTQSLNPQKTFRIYWGCSLTAERKSSDLFQLKRSFSCCHLSL